MNEWLVLFKNVDTKPFLECTKFMEHNEVDIKDRSTKGENSIQFNFVGQEASAYSPDSAMSKLSNLFLDFMDSFSMFLINLHLETLREYFDHFWRFGKTFEDFCRLLDSLEDFKDF